MWLSRNFAPGARPPVGASHLFCPPAAEVKNGIDDSLRSIRFLLRGLARGKIFLKPLPLLVGNTANWQPLAIPSFWKTFRPIPKSGRSLKTSRSGSPPCDLHKARGYERSFAWSPLCTIRTHFFAKKSNPLPLPNCDSCSFEKQTAYAMSSRSLDRRKDDEGRQWLLSVREILIELLEGVTTSPTLPPSQSPICYFHVEDGDRTGYHS